MRIGIVTIMDYTNYGNRLQNYAIYHILKEKFNISSKSLVSYKEKAFYDGNYLSWMKETVAGKLCCFPEYAEKHFGKGITRWANFQKWSKLIPTKKIYNQDKLPEKLNDQYDFFIAGSDQIWNYHFSSNRFQDYFLKFSDKKKNIALSASFGVNSIPKAWEEEYINGLKNFEYISVREDAGQKIIKDLIGINVPVLIDPTMMLSQEEWTKVSREPRVDLSKPYILKYYLGDEKEDNKIDDWAEKNGYKVYELLNDQIPELYSAGPGEFVSLIKNASLVCSDSFHCIVFSIIFSKPFLVYSRLGSENYMTSRLDTLLRKFHFQSRWKDLVKEEDYLNCDYSGKQELMKNEQKKFMDYLTEALKK